MSDQFENENQQPQTIGDLRQSLLAEIEASKQAIEELSDEQLEEIAGGAGLPFLRRTMSAPGRLEMAPFHDSRPTSPASSVNSPLNALSAVHDETSAYLNSLRRRW